VIHIRAVSPSDCTPGLVESLRTNPGVVNVIVLEGVARNPDGDAVQFDVIAAQANRVLGELRTLALDRRGSIVIEDVGAMLSDRAARAEGSAARGLRFLPIWEEAEARIRAGGRYPPSWFLLLTIAGLIGAVGIFTNSQILIVGAMVVGPEYGAIASVALGIDEKHRSRVRAGLAALGAGFLVAILATLVFSLVVRVVAALAGIVGVVSLVEARAGALIGVFISVTTIPAAADIGVSMAFEDWSEARGSLVQLLLNVVILIAVGAAGLPVQRRVWRRVVRRSEAT
jgi:hypothetical protein